MVAVAAVACAVGTPGVQQGGLPHRSLRRTLPGHPTGGMPPPPPRHLAAVFTRSAVRRGPLLWAVCMVLGMPEPCGTASACCWARQRRRWLRRCVGHRFPAEAFPDCDFNLGEGGIRDIRGRVVSRLRPFNHGRGYALGYAPSRFTGLFGPAAITCAGHLAVIFFGLFCLVRA